MEGQIQSLRDISSSRQATLTISGPAWRSSADSRLRQDKPLRWNLGLATRRSIFDPRKVAFTESLSPRIVRRHRRCSKTGSGARPCSMRSPATVGSATIRSRQTARESQRGDHRYSTANAQLVGTLSADRPPSTRLHCRTESPRRFTAAKLFIGFWSPDEPRRHRYYSLRWAVPSRRTWPRFRDGSRSVLRQRRA